MRTIKFRGKKIIDGVWIKGESIINGTYTYIKDVNIKCQWSEVNPETIGLFTGLKDKNEIEIYEGDILIDREISEGVDINGYFPVSYVPEKASFCIDNSFKKDRSNLSNLVYYFGIENLEVIGNIYDNPELLK